MATTRPNSANQAIKSRVTIPRRTDHEENYNFIKLRKTKSQSESHIVHEILEENKAQVSLPLSLLITDIVVVLSEQQSLLKSDLNELNSTIFKVLASVLPDCQLPEDDNDYSVMKDDRNVSKLSSELHTLYYNYNSLRTVLKNLILVLHKVQI